MILSRSFRVKCDNKLTTSRPFILPLVLSPKALFLAIYSSPCALPLSVLWSPPFPLTTTFMQTTLSSSLSTHSTLTQAFLTFKTLFNRSLPGWLLIFLLLTPFRLNSCLSDWKTNLPKYTTVHLTYPTLLEILALSLTKTLPSLTKLHLQSLLLSHSSAWLYPALPRFVNCLYHCYLCRSLQTWLL